MKRFPLLLAGLMIVAGVYAQKKPIKNPTIEFSYYVRGEGGGNGLTVSYNPVTKYYYCVQAGNAEFPLEVFNEKGEHIFATNAKQDCRGWWFNPKKSYFEGKFIKVDFIQFTWMHVDF